MIARRRGTLRGRGRDRHAGDGGVPRAVFERFEWGLLGIAFLTRLIGGLITWEEPAGDAQEYVLLGHNLASGNGFSLSEHAPFVPTDWRMPGYPAVLAVTDWLDLGDAGIVAVNSLLGAIAVAALVLMARRVFVDRKRPRLALGIAAALYPPLVTYTGVALAENISIAAVCWLVYLGFFAPVDRRRPAWWLAGWFSASSVVFLARAEGLFLIAVALLLTVWLRRIPWRIATVMIVLAAIAPLAWALRNDTSTGRFEVVDSLNRDVTLVLSVDDGQFSSPLYKRGARLARVASTEEQREAHHEAVVDHVKRTLREETSRVLTYKAKSLLNFPFTPLVFQWSADRDYVLSDAVANPDGKNVLRIGWAVVLLLQYMLALIGFIAWWNRGDRSWAIGIALYPLVALLLAIPFHGELRLWFGAAFLLLVPAIEGISVLATSRTAGQRAHTSLR